MQQWNPPNALLYLGSLLRPSLLRPDLKVSSHVDWQGLRKEGFDAVVIDKDNCLTLPEQDDLYPPLQTAWTQLLSAFPPGRVLVVSNSAGTLSKDPSGVAAESVSLSLKAPVLLHSRPKPGCASEILAYFTSPAQPTTLRARIAKKHREALKAEEEDVRELVKRFEGLVSGPVLQESGGALQNSRSSASPTDPHAAGMGVFERSYTSSEPIIPPIDVSSSSKPSRADTRAENALPSHAIKGTAEPHTLSKQPALPKISGPRIAVVGDRLFTDTLLANRLRLLLPSTTSPTSSPSPRDNVISIQTTSLPQPNDVRSLRWLESLLTRDRLRSGPTDWGRFAIREELSQVVTDREGWKKYIPFRRAYLAAPVLQWDPRTWRPVTLMVAVGKLAKWTISKTWAYLVIGGRWAVERGKKWYTEGKIGKEEIKEIGKEGMP